MAQVVDITEANAPRPNAFSILIFPVVFVAVLAGFHLFQLELGYNLNWLGVRPREVDGLLGILGMPLVHGDWKHLINNSVPLLVLGAGIFSFYRPVAWQVVSWSWILTGLWVWVGARGGTNHIGASGLVYAFASFIFFSGVIRRHKKLLALSMLVVFLYGSMVWGVFPIKPGISWEGHLYGALAGLVLAINFRRYGPQRKKFEWEDEPEEEHEDEVEWDDWKHPAPQMQPGQRQVVVRYIYRANKPANRPQSAQANQSGQQAGPPPPATPPEQ